MKRLSVALLAAGLMAATACSPATDSAFGQRPTSYPAAGGQAASAVTPAGTVDRDLVVRARQAVQAALSWDHATYDADTAAAQAFMTPELASAWDRIAARIQRRSGEHRAHAHATVVEAGVTGATDRRAQVLLLVDRRLETRDGEQSTGGYAIATLTHHDGTWLLSALGTARPRHRVVEQRPVPATVLAAATALADAWSDLDSAHPHADVARVLSLTTGPVRRAYKAAVPELVARTVSSGAVQSGTVVAAGLTTLSEDRARAIAVVETVLQVPGRKAVRRLARMQITLVRTPDAWRAREVEMVPSPPG